MNAHHTLRLREQPSGPFQPDVLLPTQQIPALRRHVTPSQRLLMAILADAVSCFQKVPAAWSRRGRREVAEAEQWLMSTDREWPFSCENICDVLGLDSEHLRHSLQRWREQQRPPVEPKDAVSQEALSGGVRQRP